jgi:type IV pilus assembly protein PilM
MSILTSWLASAPPDAAIEIGSEAVCAATVSGRGSEALVQHHAVEQLQPGSVVPSLTAQNVLDPSAVVAGLQLALDRLGTRPRRVALVIPDLAAKVSLVHFDQVPAKHDDLEQLIRWQLRKSAPFPVDEACVTFVPACVGATGGREFLVVLARRDIVREYEEICERAGVYPGLVDLSTLNVVNCLLAGSSVPTGDWLVIHMRSDYTSIVIMRGTEVIFFRNKSEGEGDTLADLVHQTTMYYQDRLSGQGFTRVLLGGNGRTGADVDAARRSLEDRLGVPVEPIDATRVAGLAASAGASRDVVVRLAPLVGVLLRSRQEMVSA